jgi:hypothetical protein
VSPSSPPLPDGSQAAATSARWWLATAVASLICGILSLLLFGAYFAGIFTLPEGWLFLLGWFLALSLACGVLGVVLGHLACAGRAALRRGGAVLATAGLVLSYGGTLLPLVSIALIYLFFLLAGPFPIGP